MYGDTLVKKRKKRKRYLVNSNVEVTLRLRYLPRSFPKEKKSTKDELILDRCPKYYEKS